MAIGHAKKGGNLGHLMVGECGRLPCSNCRQPPSKSKLKGTHGGHRYSLPKEAEEWTKNDAECSAGREIIEGIPHFAPIHFGRTDERLDCKKGAGAQVVRPPAACDGPSVHIPVGDAAPINISHAVPMRTRRATGPKN